MIKHSKKWEKKRREDRRERKGEREERMRLIELYTIGSKGDRHNSKAFVQKSSSPFTFNAVELSAHLSSFLPSLNSPISSLCTSTYTYKNFTRFSEKYFLSFANNFNTSFSFSCWPCLVHRMTHSLKKQNAFKKYVK